MKRLIRILLIINVVVLLGYFTKLLVAKHNNSILQKQLLLSVAHGEEASGVMTQQNYLRLTNISQNIEKTGRISDRELDWCIALMQSPMRQTGYNAPLLRVKVVYPLLQLKYLSSEQKEKLYQAIVPMFNTTNDTQKGLDRLYATAMVAKLEDKRAIPYLLPLLNDPRPKVRQKAQKALNALGYKSPS